MTLPVAPPARRGSTRVSSKRLLTREEAVSEDYDLTPGPDDASGSASSGDAQDTPLLKAPEEKYCGPLRLVLLGQNGVGKSSLALSLAGLSDESLSVDSETLSGKAVCVLFPFLFSYPACFCYPSGLSSRSITIALHHSIDKIFR